MRIDFNILWVDDQPKGLGAQKDGIDRRMRSEGFRLCAEFVTSVDKAIALVSESIYRDHIDLVLMDYDLGSSTKGDEGLLKIREKLQYKDIVFYSAISLDELHRLVEKKGISGVFCSHRNHLVDDVIGQFETLIKKVLDIDHARGIVLGSSSDIEGLVNDGLAAHFRKTGGKISDSAKKIILEQAEKIRENRDKELEKLGKATNIDELLELHLVYSGAHRQDLLRKLLKELKLHAEAQRAMIDYADKTVPKRNDLAHVRAKKTTGFARKLEDRNGKEFTVEAVRKLRLELLQHQEALEKLVEALRNA